MGENIFVKEQLVNNHGFSFSDPLGLNLSLQKKSVTGKLYKYNNFFVSPYQSVFRFVIDYLEEYRVFKSDLVLTLMTSVLN